MADKFLTTDIKNVTEGYHGKEIPVSFANGVCAVVRALASHHCGLGSIPAGCICGLCLLLVLA